MAHTRSVPVCSCLLGPPARVPLFVCEGGGASAVFSAARFRFPFESLSYLEYLLYELSRKSLRTAHLGGCQAGAPSTR